METGRNTACRLTFGALAQLGERRLCKPTRRSPFGTAARRTSPLSPHGCRDVLLGMARTANKAVA